MTCETEALAKRAADAVDSERVVALTQDLVRIRSVFEPTSANGNEAAVAHFIADSLRRSGLAPIVEEVAPGRPNVICDWQGARFDPARHKTLLFEGHSDVVTEGDPTLWCHPPFGGELIEGQIYGRGSADMKAGIAAAIAALEAVRRAAPELPGRIRLGIVADEEGLMLGIKHFIDRGWAREVDGAVICEPEENELCQFQKGALRVEVMVAGVMAHGAMPYAGCNPIPALAAFVQGVSALQAAEQARLGAHPYLGLPWFTPTIVRAPATGEAQLNVIPETAYLALDIRTIPGQEHEAIWQELSSLAADLMRSHGVKITLTRLDERPWTETPSDAPLVRALERAYRLTFNREPRYGGVPGATDGTFLHAWAGVPIVTVGPGDRTIPHRRDEFVRVADIVAAARLYAAAAVYFLSEPRL
jgi:succinyl-diaminopimelate desuccinylase